MGHRGDEVPCLTCDGTGQLFPVADLRHEAVCLCNMCRQSNLRDWAEMMARTELEG